MRAGWSLLVLAGCGPVHLGDERPTDHDAGERDGSAGGPAVAVVLAITSQPGCDGCFEVSATGAGGRPPYSFEWSDGSSEANRRICPGAAGDTLSVTAFDADGAHATAHTTPLAPSDAGCSVVQPARLCLENGSFEGVPVANLNGIDFDCAPWKTCTNPVVSNTPEVVNDTIEQILATIPQPTDGLTFLGLTEGEQVSQRLCLPLTGGSEVSFRIDLSRLYIGGGVVPDTELPYLEVLGGVAAGCSAEELLWASDPLPDGFTTYCVTLRPSQFMDSLFLRARSDNSLPSVSYLLVDKLEPVDACP